MNSLEFHEIHGIPVKTGIFIENPYFLLRTWKSNIMLAKYNGSERSLSRQNTEFLDFNGKSPNFQEFFKIPGISRNSCIFKEKADSDGNGTRKNLMNSYGFLAVFTSGM